MNSALRTPHSALDLASIYRRVSTDHQDGSLELQEQRVLNYVSFRGLTVDDSLTFSDPDTSGRTPILDRTGGRALINRLKLGDVRHLVIAKLDRLGRNVRDALGVLEFLKEHEITLHITDFGGESISTQGHMGRLILTMLFAVSEWEVEEIRDRTLKTARAKFDRNELTGNIPFGFDCIYTFADGAEERHIKVLTAEQLAGRPTLSKKLVPNEAEQTVIELMFELRFGNSALRTPNSALVKKRSLKQVAEYLNERGYFTKHGAAWSQGTVDSVLKSRHTQKVLQTSALAE